MTDVFVTVVATFVLAGFPRHSMIGSKVGDTHSVDIEKLAPMHRLSLLNESITWKLSLGN
jgi:predicted anti-sigma-YlaC factor YlaD